MKKTLRLAKREYKSSVKSKGFVIGLILAPIFMSGGLIAFLLLKDRVDTTDKKVAILDRSGVVAVSLVEAAEARNEKGIHDKSGKKIKPGYHFEVVEPEGDLQAQKLELSDRVRRGELHGFIDVLPDIVHPQGKPNAPRLIYHAKSAAMDDLRGWINWPVNNQLRKLRLADAGIDESSVSDLFNWANVEPRGLVSVDKETGRVKGAKRANEAVELGVPVIMMFLMFLMIMMSVPSMLQTVMEEKTQRIAEVLLGSIKPFEFMMGKVIGGIAVSLTSSLVYIVGGIIYIRYMNLGQYIPYHVLPWFFAYMLLAIVMLGAMSAALGSTCNEPKDAQSLTFPSLIPVIIPMFIYFAVVKEPLSSFATWVSFFPTFTPTLMLLRMTTPAGIPAWQPWLGLLGMAITTVIFVWAGGRVFRVGILTQGTPPKLANIVRWVARG